MTRLNPKLFRRGPSISRRFVAATAVMLLPLVLLALSGYLVFNRTVAIFDATLTHATEGLEAARELERAIAALQLAGHDHVVLGEAGAHTAAVEAQTRSAAAAMRRLQAVGGPEAARLPPLLAEAEAYIQTLLAQPAEPAEARARLDGLHRRFEPLQRGLDALCESLRASVRDRQDHALGHRRQVLVLIGVFLLLGVSVVLGTGLLLARSVLRPLRALEQGAVRLGAGDLAHRVRVSRGDEFGHVASHFNRMAEVVQGQQARLRELASRDPLTGLYNKREFSRRLDEEIARAERYGHPLCLAVLDIDHFKQINDERGHPVGDEVLKDLAALLGTALRPADTVARYGGEEFVIVMPQIDLGGALASAERLCATVRGSRFAVATERPVALTVSLGVAQFGRAAPTAAALIDAADRAMYAAKAGGRDRVCAAAADVRG